eukprot:11195127-Lingulodinium_polyedra.AAC.1
MLLPAGVTQLVDRGAEQGDPLGSVRCGLCIMKAVGRLAARLEELGAPLYDAWFLDDGHWSCRPEHVET